MWYKVVFIPVGGNRKHRKMIWADSIVQAIEMLSKNIPIHRVISVKEMRNFEVIYPSEI